MVHERHRFLPHDVHDVALPGDEPRVGRHLERGGERFAAQHPELALE
jgi:hypothetical protein